MSYTVTAHLDIDVSPEVAFDTLADHGSWPKWMPSSFKPVGPSLGTLRVGLAPKVRIAGLPVATPIEIKVVERPREITWSGGSALMSGEHSFLFEARDSGTRITSSEIWRGPIAWLLRPILQPGAARVGRAQLRGLERGARLLMASRRA